jgi:hypothetical protein
MKPDECISVTNRPERSVWLGERCVNVGKLRTDKVLTTSQLTNSAGQLNGPGQMPRAFDSESRQQEEVDDFEAGCRLLSFVIQGRQ